MIRLALHPLHPLYRCSLLVARQSVLSDFGQAFEPPALDGVEGYHTHDVEGELLLNAEAGLAGATIDHDVLGVGTLRHHPIDLRLRLKQRLIATTLSLP